MTFRVIWQVDDAEWFRVRRQRLLIPPGSHADRDIQRPLKLLWVPLAMAVEREHQTASSPDDDVICLLGSPSLLDFAVQLDHIRRDSMYDAKSYDLCSTYVESFGQNSLRFIREHDSMQIVYDLDIRSVLVMPYSEFAKGIDEFLFSFVSMITLRAPRILEWECVGNLRGYGDFASSFPRRLQGF